MNSVVKKEDAISWGILGGIVLLLYFVFSDGQFSLIFTLAGTVQTFGFALIAIKIRKSRSVTGLSRETFICYGVIFFVRFFLFLLFKVYSVPCRYVAIYAGLSSQRYYGKLHFQGAGGIGALPVRLYPLLHLRDV
jgi:uncharacterized protein with PQ loop repeat